MSQDKKVGEGLDVLGALILVREKRARVTFRDGECVVEVEADKCGPNCGGRHHVYEYHEVGRADTFLRAVYAARKECGW